MDWRGEEREGGRRREGVEMGDERWVMRMGVGVGVGRRGPRTAARERGEAKRSERRKRRTGAGCEQTLFIEDMHACIKRGVMGCNTVAYLKTQHAGSVVLYPVRIGSKRTID